MTKEHKEQSPMRVQNRSVVSTKRNLEQETREMYYKVQTTARGGGMNGSRVEIPETVLSAHDFPNHFKPLISGIGKPNSHNCYFS